MSSFCKRHSSGTMSPLFALMVAGFFLSSQLLRADDNPYDGYADKTDSYFLSYTNGTSFAPNNANDVQVALSIDGISHTLNVDTGSRGLYLSSEALGDGFTPGPDAYAGEIDL